MTHFTPLATDGYKLSHWNMYPEGTEIVYSYAECRGNSEYDTIVFFGLQPYLIGLASADIRQFADLMAEVSLDYFGSESVINVEGWKRLAEVHGNRLPLKIKALPEGTICRPGEVLFTIENTDPEFFWLTNYIEAYISKVWYPMTVATVSRSVKEAYAKALYETTGSLDGLEWKLHDFGYRGVSSEESAMLGGMAHLVNFQGTDTLAAIAGAATWYDVDTLHGIAGSVPATEHSVMTAYGREGEAIMFGELLDKYPTGVLSVVADSYDVYNFVSNIVCDTYKQQILDRNGTLVVRPDSNTPRHPNPEDQVLWIYEELWEAFGGTVTEQGYMMLNPKVNVLWGDGIGPDGIVKIIDRLVESGFVPTFVAGMGGGLLQKVNRDTLSFAIKSSAQRRNGDWFDIVKDPLDKSKKSKTGRFEDRSYGLETVFLNGEIVNPQNFYIIKDLADRGLL